MQEPRTVMETHSIQIPQYTHTYTTYGAPIMGTVPTGYKSSAPPTEQGLAYQTTTDDAISA